MLTGHLRLCQHQLLQHGGCLGGEVQRPRRLHLEARHVPQVAKAARRLLRAGPGAARGGAASSSKACAQGEPPPGRPCPPAAGAVHSGHRWCIAGLQAAARQPARPPLQPAQRRGAPPPPACAAPVRQASQHGRGSRPRPTLPRFAPLSMWAAPTWKYLALSLRPWSVLRSHASAIWLCTRGSSGMGARPGAGHSWHGRPRRRGITMPCKQSVRPLRWLAGLRRAQARGWRLGGGPGGNPPAQHPG